MKKQVVISEAVDAEVKGILHSMLGLSKEKAGKLVVKSFGYDKKLNAFLNADFSKGLAIFVQKERREKLYDAVEEHGITDATRKRALLITMLQADVNAQVAEKRAEITLEGKLPMDKEQSECFEQKIVEYRKFLENQLNPGVIELGKFVGAWDVKDIIEEPVEKEIAA